MNDLYFNRAITTLTDVAFLIIFVAGVDFVVQLSAQRKWHHIRRRLQYFILALCLSSLCVIPILYHLPIYLVLVWLTVVTLVGALLVEDIQAIALWIVANFLILPRVLATNSVVALENGIYTDGLLTFSASNFAALLSHNETWLVLAGGAGTLPLFLYVRRAAKQRHNLLRLHLLGAGLLVIFAFAIGYFAATVVAREAPRLTANEQYNQRRLSVDSALAALDLFYSPKDVSKVRERYPKVSAENEKLAHLALWYSHMVGQNIFIIREHDQENEKRYEFVLAAKGGDQAFFASGGKTSRVVHLILNLEKMNEAELQIVFGAIKRQRFERNNFPAYDPLYMTSGEARSTEKIFGLISGGQADENDPRQNFYDPRDVSEYLLHEENQLWLSAGGPPVIRAIPDRISDWTDEVFLVATSTKPRWWEPAQVDLATASQAILLWVWIGLIIQVPFGMFALQKRDELRQKLTKEQVRSRIMQDAHDRVANRLSALALRADTARVNEAESSSLLESLPHTIRQLVVELKNIITNITPVLDEASPSLRSSIEAICKQRESDYNLSITVDIEVGEPSGSDLEVRQMVVSFLEETLSNIAQHAGATKASVTINKSQTGQYRMIIEDNGSGFTPPVDFSALPGQDHLGLAGIDRRAKELHGHLNIQSAPEKGARIEISWKK